VAFQIQPRLLGLGSGDELGHLASFKARALHQTVAQRASMSNARSVRLLCASSTTTKGRRRRSTLASEQGVVRSAPSPSLSKPIY
jgi:hypothetical protein